MNATDSDSAYITVVVQRRHQHLRRTRVLFRRRDILDDGVHQIRQVRLRLAPIGTHPALFGAAVQRLEIQLIIRRVQVAHQVKYLFLYLVRTAVLFVHFVDYDDRFQTQFQRFLKHKARLRHRAFERIYQQQYAVGHVQHTLHFSAEVRVTRSVDDVDLNALVLDGDILRQNGDTALALQVVVVQYQLSLCTLYLVTLYFHSICRVQHLIDQRRLAVVNVRNDGYISYVLHILCMCVRCTRRRALVQFSVQNYYKYLEYTRIWA